MTANTKTIKISLWKHIKINPLPQWGALQHNQYKLVQQYLMTLVCFKPFCSVKLTKCCCLSSLLDCAKWRCISKWVVGVNDGICYPPEDGFKFSKAVEDWIQLEFHPVKKMEFVYRFETFLSLLQLYYWLLMEIFVLYFDSCTLESSEHWRNASNDNQQVISPFFYH